MTNAKISKIRVKAPAKISGKRGRIRGGHLFVYYGADL